MTRNRSVVLTLAALMFALSSCSDYLSPVKGYLERYTEDAFIYGHGILTEYHIDGDGVDSVPSAGSARVNFWLRNPNEYEMTATVRFNDDTVEASRTEGACSLYFNGSWTGLSLELSPDFLVLHEGGGNLSGTISLADAETGRNFPSYRFTLRSNSLPPLPAGSRVMLDSANNYVVCFNLDLSDSIHDDLASIELDEDVWTISSLTTGAVQSITFLESGASTTEPAGGLFTVAELDAFTPQSGMTPVYLTTSVSYADEPAAAFTIGVRDRRGLLRSVITSTEGDQLVPVRFERHNTTEIPDGSFITLPGDGAQVILINTNPGSTVMYTVVTDGVITAEQSFTETRRTITLPAGTSVITAHASMTGYIDSDPVTITVTTDVQKLSPVTFTTYGGLSIPAGATRTLDSGETSIFVVSPNTAATVHYTVNGGAEQTFTGAQEEITLAVGAHEITAWATRTGYTDSDPTTIHVIIEQQLDPVTFTTAAGTTLAAGSSTTLDGGVGGTAEVIMHLPNSASTVLYRVDSGAEQTFTTMDYTLPLTTGTYSITAWASGNGYADSDPVTITVTVTSTANVYVDNNTGVDTNPGTQGQPCKTISGAYAKFPNKNNPTNRIVLLNDITREDGTSGALANLVITEATQLIIDGQGLYAINAESAPYVRGMTVTGAGELDLTLSELQILNAVYWGSGAGLYVYNEHARVVLADCVIENNDSSGSATGLGAGIYCWVESLTLHDTTVIGNDLSDYTSMYGSGIYVGHGTFFADQGTTITENTISSGNGTNKSGYGAGLCIENSSSVIMNNVTITLNGISGAALLGGTGAGVYVNVVSSMQCNTVLINENYITPEYTGSDGEGAGLFFASTDCTLTACTISQNVIVVLDRAYGAGVYQGNSSTLNLNGTTISDNTGTAATSRGGGLFIGDNGTTTMTLGQITGNSANLVNPTLINSQGDGVYITGANLSPSTFTLNSGVISGNQSPKIGVAETNIAFYLNNQYTTLILGAADVQIPSSNVVHLVTAGATIMADAFLTNSPVATLEFNTYSNGTNVLSSTPENNNCNYYKFEVVSPAPGVEYCINADGNLSSIESRDAGDYGELANWLSTAPQDGSTRVINLAGITYTIPSGSVLNLRESSHCHIKMQSNVVFMCNGEGSAFAYPASGQAHLLIDCGIYFLDISYFTTLYRDEPIFNVQQPGSSLVVRGVRITDAQRTAGGVAAAPLFSAAGARVTLQGFTFNDTSGKDNSRFSAIMLANNSLCHFVSGEISGFNCSEANYGGVAHVDGTSSFYVHSGTFDDNSTVGVSSVTQDGGGYVWLGAGVFMH